MPSSATASVDSVEQVHVQQAWNLPRILGLLALAALWFVCFRHLSAEWSYNEQYNYGWFVPFFALYLLWLRWEDRPAPVAAREAPSSNIQHPKNRRSVIAWAIAIPALLLLFPLRLTEVANPDWRVLSWLHTVAAVILTLTLVWWLGGKPWLRHFAFPIVFVLVAVPWFSSIEAPIIQGLMPLVASIATETLSLFGIPAEVQGNLIRINDGVIGVNEACSGVRSLQTSLMIGLLFGELTRLSVARRIALVAAAIAIAFVANCGRAFFLVWIAATRGVPQVEHWHDFAGYAIVGLVFAGCLILTKLFKPAEKTAADANNSTPAAPTFVIRHSSFVIPSTAAIAILAYLVVVEAAVEAWYRSHERNLQPSTAWNVRWPEKAAAFREIPIAEQTRTILHYDEGRGVSWHGQATETSTAPDTASLLYFFRWKPGHNSALLANAHRPDVCLPASGWKQTGDFGVREYAVGPDFKIPFRHFQFSFEGQGRFHTAHAFYCVWEDRVKDRSSDAQARSLASEPSSWTRSERIEAVVNGRRHLGQQVMEYLLLPTREMSAEEAEKAFGQSVQDLVVQIRPTTQS